MQASADGIEGLFEMWDDLEVPVSPPLSYGEITPPIENLSPSLSPNNNNSNNTNSNNNNSNSNDTPLLIVSHPPLVTPKSENNSIPTPIHTFVSSTTPANNKKRKSVSVSEVAAENANSPLAWMEYSYGPKVFPIHDALSFHQMTENIDVVVQNVNSNCSYSQSDGAWICYRQNQFKVICLFRGPAVETLCVNDEGVAKKLTGVSAKLYSVKDVSGVLSDEMRVGLHHVGKKRLKSAKIDVEITPFVKGKIEFTNLQFEKSNSVKKPQQQTEYFRIVVALYAQCEDNTFHILSKVSPKIIVRGQNPGFYEDKIEAHTNITNNTLVFNNPQLVNNNPIDVNNAILITNNNNNNHNNNNNNIIINNTPFLYDTTNINNINNNINNNDINNININNNNNNNVIYDSSSPDNSCDNSPANYYLPPPSLSPSLSPSISPSLSDPSSSVSPMSLIPSSQMNLSPPPSLSSSSFSPSSYTPPPFNPSPSPPTEQQQQQQQQQQNGLITNQTITEIENSFMGLKKKGDNGWVKIADTIYHHGRVGINTAIPMEALTVHGNMLVTGDIYKPSDRRIKSQFEVVDGQSQLSRIRELTIYDYVVHNKQERGVIAQELAHIIPAAVHPVGDAELNGQLIPNLLVVNERMLLYENLGATKQLDKELESEKENIVNITTQMDNITQTTNNNNSEVQGSMQFMLDVLFREEYKKKVIYAGLEEEFINFHFSVFRMGPARSLFLLGHFAHWLWVLGALYIFSNIRTRRCLGFFSLLRILVSVTLSMGLTYGKISRTAYDLNLYSAMIFAGGVLVVNYLRLKKRLRTGPEEEEEENKPPPTRLKRIMRRAGRILLPGYLE